jgi:putative ABC transport system permease protein
MTDPTARASWRYLQGHPWQLGLALLGIALGVAVVVAVELANTSAQRAFELSLGALTGRTTHQILGGPQGLDEDLYTRLRIDLGVRSSAPLVEAYLHSGEETLHLLGIDPLAEAGVRSYLEALQPEILRRLMVEPGAVLMPAVTAARLGLDAGDTLRLMVGATIRDVHIVGLLRPPQAREQLALDGVLVSDIATAQELLGREGLLDRIDLVLRDEPAAQALRRALPPGLQLLPARARTRSTLELTRAFRINLQAMGLLAVVVGLFLIYNAMGFSVLQRRGLFATLRVLGVTQGRIFRQLISEALLIGGLGSLVGLGLGMVLAKGLLGLVLRTINDLYFVLHVSQTLLAPDVLLKGLALGTGAAVLAALAPAWEAAHTPPRLAQNRSLTETRVHRAAPWLALAGVMITLLAAALLWVPGGDLVLGFVSLFLFILGFALASPLAVVALARAGGRVLAIPAGLVGRLAARGVEAALSRTGVAVTALAVAVSATVGVGVMVGSFRATVERWLDHSLKADIYVSSPHGVSSRADASLPPQVLKRLRTLPGVSTVSYGRRVTLEAASGPIDLLALAPGPRGPGGLDLKQGDPQAVREAFRDRQVILITEPYAYRHGLTTGDTLVLPTDAGPRGFPVVGVLYDYSSEQGMVVIPWRVYRRHWQDRGLSSVGLYLAPGEGPADAMARVRTALADLGAVSIRSTGEIRRASLEIFDRTFAITRVLRLLALGVAFIGILSALMALQLERAREYAILRATGFTPGQVVGIVGLQTLFMGACAAALAMPLGLVMSQLLIHVINRRAFGWSMTMEIPQAVLLEAVVLALLAALLGGLYPAWRLSRTPPARALREE